MTQKVSKKIYILCEREKNKKNKITKRWRGQEKKKKMTKRGRWDRKKMKGWKRTTTNGKR